MQSQKPKQFLLLNDEPIISITLKALLNTGLISKFIVPTVDMIFTRKIIRSYLPDLDVDIVKGGKSRQDSISNALALIAESKEQPDLILIHDAVRALVRKSTIELVINKALQMGAATAATPVTDTLKLSYVNERGELLIKKNISRDYIWQIQTPQVFKSDILIKANAKAREEHFTGTDSTSLLERFGLDVALVESPKTNIKITTPEDLKLAQILYSQAES